MAIASLVLGILAVVFCFIPGFNLLAPILGIVGIILAVLARKQAKTPSSTGGLILSIIGLVLGIIMWVACSICMTGTSKMMQQPEFKGMIEQSQKKAREMSEEMSDLAKKQMEKASEQVKEQTQKATEQINDEVPKAWDPVKGRYVD